MASLRGFQPAAVDGALQRLVAPAGSDGGPLLQGASTLLVLATGTGKTTIAGEVIRRIVDLLQACGDQRRILWMVERIALVDQAWDSLRLHLPESIQIGTEQGARSARSHIPLGMGGDRVVVASVDTIRRPVRLSRMCGGPDTKLGHWSGQELVDALARTFALVVVDEAHCGIENKQYHGLYQHFGQIPRLGLTATPYSADGSRGMGDHWNSEAFVYTLDQAIEAGDLVPVVPKAVPLAGVNLEGIEFNKENLTRKEQEAVAEAYKNEQALHQIAAVLAQQVARPALVFCASTEHSKSLALAMARYGVTAEHTDCYQLETVQTEDGRRVKERQEILERYKAGKIDFLFNFGLYVTGMDAPITAAVVFCHPRNRRQCAQAIGRVTRWCCAGAWNYGVCTCGRNKRKGEVWDFYSDSQMAHAGISSYVFALAPGIADEAEIVELNNAVSAFDEADPTKTATQSKQIQADAARARARAAAVKAQIRASDLLDAGPLAELEGRLGWAGLRLPRPNGVRCTEEQLRAVAHVVFQPRATKQQRDPKWRGALCANQAEAILREDQRRRKAGLCSLQLVGMLRSARQIEKQRDGSTKTVPLVALADLRTLPAQRGVGLWRQWMATVGVK